MEETLKSQKNRLRQSILEKRLSLTEENVLSISQKIQERLLASPFWIGKERIGLYSAIKNEIQTRLLFMRGLEEGISIYFPRVEQGIKFYEVKEPSDLQKGAWGILEPKDECPPLLKDESLGLLVVPGLVFDRQGHRLGYGKGFYDAVLEQFPTQTLGLSYDFQIVDELPVEPWDRKVRRVLTEKKLYEFENSK